MINFYYVENCKFSNNILISNIVSFCCWTCQDSEGLSEADKDLKDLKDQLSDDFPVGPLIKKCRTLDQVDIV